MGYLTAYFLALASMICMWLIYPGYKPGVPQVWLASLWHRRTNSFIFDGQSIPTIVYKFVLSCSLGIGNHSFLSHTPRSISLDLVTKRT